ncbi:hypothetical protein SBY92_004891 [Candida maltosa Xu316]
MSDQPLPQSVSNWLFNVIQPLYHHKQIVYAHVYQFLQLHLKKNLNFRIRTKVYTSNVTGESNLLINLFGSIVINPQISVPVEIWVPLTYPYVDSYDKGVPLVYVVPDHSKSWYLKPTNNVDMQGMFYHPYLSTWNRECSQSDPIAGKKFNLVELINAVYHSVTKDCPISSTRPEIIDVPPKPAKIELAGYGQSVASPPPVPASPYQYSPATSGGASPSTNPPLPAKPPKVQSPGSQEQRGVPLKYQSPLPLPQQNTNQFTYPQEGTTSPLHPINYASPEPQPQPQPQPPTPVAPSPVKDSPPVDLMDSDGYASTSDSQRREMLEKLSIDINNCLNDDDINKDIGKTNENGMKISALYNQLSHHYQQASQNSKNLDDHINYLSTQLAAITSLNNELSKLDKINCQSVSQVAISSTNSLPLDDLVIPDSPIVKQLYEITSEIKAIKDTISLISGSFHDQPELVNDDRFDACVKAVRNLGRDLFWLELTRDEIAFKIMNLK